MNKAQKKLFEHDMKMVWGGVKNAVAPEYHPRLRKVFMRIIREDEKEYQEFVALMSTEKEDTVNKKLDDAAEAMRREQELAAAEDFEVARISGELKDKPLFQCHYCGTMCHIKELTGAKEGLVCYKCRHEMENRE